MFLFFRTKFTHIFHLLVVDFDVVSSIVETHDHFKILRVTHTNDSIVMQ